MMEFANETVEDRWQRLRERTAVPGWKGPRSVAVAAATWDAARELARVVSDETGNRAVPFVSASESGSIVLTWGKAPGVVVSVELAADGGLALEVDGPDGFKSAELERSAGVAKQIIDSLAA